VIEVELLSWKHQLVAEVARTSVRFRLELAAELAVVVVVAACAGCACAWHRLAVLGRVPVGLPTVMRPAGEHVVAFSSSSDGSSGLPWWKRRWVWGVALVVAVAAAVVDPPPDETVEEAEVVSEDNETQPPDVSWRVSSTFVDVDGATVGYDCEVEAVSGEQWRLVDLATSR